MTCVALAHASTTQVSTRGVAAQVLSGVGSRGAGAIFRESLNVRGLNTAAILWWSAAIGVLAGGGYAACAAIATAFVVFLNLLLRPIVSFINRQPLVSTELEIGYVVSIIARRGAHPGFTFAELGHKRIGARNLDSGDLNGSALVLGTAFVKAH